MERLDWSLNDLGLFAAVVSHGGFSPAARAMGIPKSRLSRRIAALEDELGVRLVERSNRRFKVTEIGQDVYRHAQAALSEAAAVNEVVARVKAEPQGLVRISSPHGLDRLLAVGAPGFLAKYPKVRLQFVVTNRRVDLIEEGIDLAIRMRQHLDSDADLQVKIIGRTGALLVASPKFVAAHGSPTHPAEIAQFPTIGLTERLGADQWVLTSEAGESSIVVHEPRLSAMSFSFLMQAALQDLGITLLPEHVCRDLLQSGELVRILPEWHLGAGMIHMVFPSRRSLLPSVRAAIDYFSRVLKPNSPAWASEDALRP